MRVNSFTSVGTSRSSGREEVSDCCLCIGEFLQPVPFIQKQYSSIYDSSDGFADRILFCTPKPHLLRVQQVEDWAEKLVQSPIQSLQAPAMLVESWHPDTKDVEYSLSPEAKAVYMKFADEIVDLMNEKWNDVWHYDSIGNVSKDMRTVLTL